LADEPTGNLDAKTGEMVMSLLEDLQRRRKLSFLYITHNSEFARRADRTLHLYKGTLGARFIFQNQRSSSSAASAFGPRLPKSEGGGTHV